MPDASKVFGTEPILKAKVHPAGVITDSHFYSATLASDGCIYYTLCTHKHDKHGQMCRYEPKKDEVKVVADFGKATGEFDTKTVSQGKSHAPFFELDGKLYFSTHVGYFKSEGAKEIPAPTAPLGYTIYPGGHCAAYDMKTEKVEDFGIPVKGEGIITFNMDKKRKRLYYMTWPSGHFGYYDIKEKRYKDFGPSFLEGEIGMGDRYMVLCRAMAVYPVDGSVFFTHADGTIMRYNYAKDKIEKFEGVSMKRDIFGQHDPHKPGHMAYHWREIFWNEANKVFYGTHPRTGYLFSFDPSKPEIKLIDRLSARPIKERGDYEPYHYGYGGLSIGPDNETIYYITGIPRAYGQDPRKYGHKGAVLKLTTYNLRTEKYNDWGIIQLEDGRVTALTHSVIPHPDGRVYIVPWIVDLKNKPDNDPSQVDLVSFPNPINS